MVAATALIPAAAALVPATAAAAWRRHLRLRLLISVGLRGAGSPRGKAQRVRWEILRR